MNQYNLTSLFASGRYVGSRYYYERAATLPRTGALTLPRIMERLEIAPVHGVPMRARDTLLAQLLRAGLHIPALEDMQAIRGFRRLRNPAPLPRRREDWVRVAKDRLPKGGLLGIEIEHYPAPGAILPPPGLTSAVGDGSLSSGGLEIRRVTWAGKTGRLGGLLGLAPFLQGGTVDTRCGLHVHVDVRHLDLPGMGTPESALCDAGETYDRLCGLYPILKKLVPKSRLRSSYCRWRNNRRESPDFRGSGNGNRYAALNFDAYSEHGTIEWRMQGGSCNVVKIESWALLCQHLTRWVSVRDHSVPRTWEGFLAILPRWLASWCILRRERLWGELGPVDDRVRSAAESGNEEGGDR